MCDSAMFSSVCALPSPTSAEAGTSLFGRFNGTMAQSDFSCACTSAVRFMAFADRSRSFDQDAQEISRFSCMLFLSVRGFYRLRRTGQLLAINAAAVLPSSHRNGVGILCHGLFEAQSPRPLIPLSTLQPPPRDDDRKTRGQDGFAVLLSCRALSSPTTCRFSPAHSGLPVIQPQSGNCAEFSKHMATRPDLSGPAKA